MPIGNSAYNIGGYLPLYGIYGAWENDFSSMYPNNWLGVENDAKKCQFQTNVLRLEQQAKQVQAYEQALAQAQLSNVSQLQRNTSAVISNNNNVLSNLFASLNVSTNPLANPLSSAAGGNVKRIPESKIMDTLREMGSGTYVADRINQEIVVKDENGKDKKITILNRLLELVDAYRKDPGNTELSKANFEKIWDIASKYKVDGDISSDDFTTLKKIALNPVKDASKEDDVDDADGAGGAGDAGDAEDPDNDDDNDSATATKQRSSLSAEYDTGHKNKQSNTQFANDFVDAFYGMGTKCDQANTAKSNIDEHNIIEFLDIANKKCDDENGETLIEAILDDCTNWGTGRSTNWFTDDDAKPFIGQFAENMTKRASDISTLLTGDANKATLNNLNEKVSALNDIINALNSSAGHKKGDDITKDEKESLIKAFNDLHKAIKAAEEKLFGVDK